VKDKFKTVVAQYTRAPSQGWGGAVIAGGITGAGNVNEDQYSNGKNRHAGDLQVKVLGKASFYRREKKGDKGDC